MTKKLSTESYKGVRDFYPEDHFVQNYIFDTWRTVLKRFGYSEYSASLIEPTDLYRAKSGEEIVTEQTYSFEDRGGRDVTLRPEMTPTVARLVAARKRELAFPLRWYSIPNLFRYERPQKGRLREHWQLNVDLFGSNDSAADIEIVSIAAEIMHAFGATSNDYEIRINSRACITMLTQTYLKLPTEKAHAFGKLVDRKAKMPEREFLEALEALVGENTSACMALLSVKSLEEFGRLLPQELLGEPAYTELHALLTTLHHIGISNARFDPTLMRGFDYYTGMLFEVFDTDPENNRSMAGGGRYDDLLAIFGSEKVPAVGFGMGDVTLLDFLETRGLLPVYRAPALLFLCTVSPAERKAAHEVAQTLREEGIAVEVNINDKKIAEQIKLADKKNIPYVVCIGEKEAAEKTYTVKKLKDGSEKTCTLKDLPSFFKDKF